MARRPHHLATDSRERLLDVATELFAQRGYAGAGVDAVADRAGIAKTALYYHFGNKEGLLAAVVERAATAWIDRIRTAASAGDTPLARLDRALTGMRALLEERPWILKLLQILTLEVADEKPEIRATLQAIVRHARAAIVAGMRDALGTDLPGAEIIASVILAFIDGIALGVQLERNEVPLDEMFDEIRRLTVVMVAVRANPQFVPWLDAVLQSGEWASPPSEPQHSKRKGPIHGSRAVPIQRSSRRGTPRG